MLFHWFHTSRFENEAISDQIYIARAFETIRKFLINLLIPEAKNWLYFVRHLRMRCKSIFSLQKRRQEEILRERERSVGFSIPNRFPSSRFTRGYISGLYDGMAFTVWSTNAIKHSTRYLYRNSIAKIQNSFGNFLGIDVGEQREFPLTKLKLAKLCTQSVFACFSLFSIIHISHMYIWFNVEKCTESALILWKPRIAFVNDVGLKCKSAERFSAKGKF